MQLLRRLAASIAAAALALSGGLPVVTAGAIQLGTPAIAAAASLTTPVVRDAVLHAASGPLASLPPFRPPFGDSEVFEPERPDVPDLANQSADPVRQAAPPGTSAMPAPNLTFETERDADNFPFVVEPPDPNI